MTNAGATHICQSGKYVKKNDSVSEVVSAQLTSQTSDEIQLLSPADVAQLNDTVYSEVICQKENGRHLCFRLGPFARQLWTRIAQTRESPALASARAALICPDPPALTVLPCKARVYNWTKAKQIRTVLRETETEEGMRGCISCSVNHTA